MTGPPHRPRTGWRSDAAGAVFSFAVEVAIVVALAVIAMLLALAALWLV